MEKLEDKRAAEALLERANELFNAQDIAGAAKLYRELLSRSPRDPRVLNRLGAIELRLGNFKGSANLFRRSVQVSPEQPLAWLSLGAALEKCGQLEDGVAACRRAIELKPGMAEAHDKLGMLLQRLGRPREALASFDRAIALDGSRADSHCNRGIMLKELNRPEEAIASFRRAIEVKPQSAAGHAGLAVMLRDLRRFDEAIASFDAAIAIDPGHAVSHWTKAETLLLAGDYEQGWKMHAWRWKSIFRRKHLDDPMFRGCPMWDGEPVEGKTVVIRPEVGLGDFIMFVRYAKLVQARGANVILYAPAPLAPLFSSLGAGLRVVVEGSPLPAMDYQCPIMDLPKVFGTTLETIPGEVPYLAASAHRLAEWKGRLGPATRPRVGLAWSGNFDRNIDRNALRRRSMPLEALRPLLALPLEFHAVQKEFAPAELAALAGAGIRQHELADFDDTAALMQHLDLVISIDTSVAHLAGALGRPLWVMLAYAADYRWMATGTRTPWYPTATLYRQDRGADWSTVIDKIGPELSRFASADRTGND